MKPTTLFIILFLFSSFTGSGQTKSELRNIYEDAEYFFIREDYPEAFYYYLQLLKYEPQNANFNFKAGECLLNMPNQEYRSIPFFLKAIKDITVNYNRRSFNETSAPLHSLFYLGNAYRINNEIDKALEVYKEFINSPDYIGNYNERIVTEEIKSCERAKIIKDKPINVIKTNIGEIVNTKTDDYSAVVSGDEKSMVFITTLKFYEGLFYTIKDESGKWSAPVNINAQVMSDGDMFPTGLSYNGQELLLTKRSDVNNEIYYSTLTGGIWSKAEPIDDNINSRSNEDFASFSKDGNTIYFTSDRRGGEGGFDIYVSKKNNNSWTEAVNMGNKINSPFDESNPVITEDGKKLYFSSNGHFNMGGFDIFYSEFKNNAWEIPVNAGYPLNTTGDNKFFIPVKNGQEGYMSLIDKEEAAGLDIFHIALGDNAKFKAEELKITENIDNEEKLQLKLIDENTGDTTNIYFNTKTQRFQFDVPKGMKVIFEEPNK